MMKNNSNYPFLVWPDPTLSKRSEEVIFPENGEEKEKFIIDLQTDLRGYIYLMRVFNGLGLSAVQMGDLRRIVVVHAPAFGVRMLVLINPVIKSLGEEPLEFMEGCLSLPGYFKKTRNRKSEITIDYLNEEGELIENKKFDGLVAACIQHEIDHLDGKMFVSGASDYERDKLRKRLKKHERVMAKSDFDWQTRYILFRASSETFFSFFEELGEAPEENGEQTITQ